MFGVESRWTPDRRHVIIRADAADTRAARGGHSTMTTAVRPMPPESEIRAIVGHQFPGGIYTVAHWENFLLTECTGADLLPDGMVHPVVLFHMPILASRTTIGEMFALGQAESDYSIGIESYDWEMFHPLREEVAYQIGGKVVAAERRARPDGRPFDRIQFQFTVTQPDGVLAARTTITWHYNRQANRGMKS